MDNNPTNEADKRNWRERLGVGSKVMPRIAEEFSKPVEPTLPTTPRSAQPVSVAKPAPMAPRVAPKPALPQAMRPQQQMPPQGAKPMQPPSPQPQEALAERLRAQRAAAEKLAEQRVLAARDRAENTRSPASSPTPPLKTTVSGAKPKFTFADDDAKQDPARPQAQAGRPPQKPLQQPPLQPQLSPPRPALGGERPVGGQTRQTTQPAAYQSQFRPQLPQGYRPIDPSTGYPPQRSYGNGAVGPDPRLPASRLNPEAYRRGGAPEDLGYPASNYDPALRGASRHDPLRAQPRSVEDDYGDDIFEEAPPPQRAGRRASATDYNQAYRENDDGYADERRRSSGPWLLLLFLMLAAAAAGAGVWYYQTKIKTVAATSSSETTPVVAAPEVSAKAAPEQPVEAQPNAGGVTPSKKQIYDRIIGDMEILGGQVTPTEEIPIQPAATEGNAQQVPQPATDGTASSGDALPLPMPPPPGSGNNTQGAIPAPAANDAVAASDPAMKKTTSEVAAAAPATDPAPAPVPGENGSAATTTQATPPSDTAPAKEEIVTDDAPVVPQKKVVATNVDAPVKVKPKPKAEKTVALGGAPVVLVAPENDVSAGDAPNASAATNQPVAANQPVVPQVAPVKKKKTLFGLFNGTNDQVNSVQAAPATPAPAPAQQVASIQNPAPEPVLKKAAPAPTTPPSASGYYVQLASFKSQGEATAEYGRLKARHSDILGSLSPVINPATVGGSTRYRLAIGPLPSRDDASNVCNSLVAAGERDCLVRKQ
jgi:cell division septation protein DedD